MPLSGVGQLDLSSRNMTGFYTTPPRSALEVNGKRLLLPRGSQTLPYLTLVKDICGHLLPPLLSLFL